MKQYVVIGIAVIGVTLTHCSDTNQAREGRPAMIESNSKPPSVFSATLSIDSRSAVFYSPDSLQLEKIKAITEKSVYESSMHEYYYQLRYVHLILEKSWRNVKIIEARNVRYLQFVRSDHSVETIDLDTKNDAYGLIVFDPAKMPSLVDLTNAETEIGFYFAPANSSRKNY